jgi:hypothetical protein
MDGTRMDMDTDWTLNVTARGGLTVGGRPVLPAGAFAVDAHALLEDAVLTPADAGRTRVVDLTSPASTGVHVTLPAASAFVGRAFEFVVKRDAPLSAPSVPLPVNNAVFSLSLQDGGNILARAVASEVFKRPPGIVIATEDRVFQAHTPVVRTPGVFFLYDGTGAVVMSSYEPHSYSIVHELQSASEIGDALYADPFGSTRVIFNQTAQTLSSPGYRVSLASSCDTVRVESVAPDMVLAECLFRYATAWS